MKSVIATLSLVAVISLTTLAHATTPQNKDAKLTRQEISALIVSARTPAEHQRIADYFNAKALGLFAESAMHQKMAEEFKANPVTNSAKQQTGTVNHCEYFATALRSRAEHFQQLAQQHEQMAAQSQK